MPEPTTHHQEWGDVALALDPDRIVDTVRVLERRILERFPDSGLGRVCGALVVIAEQTKDRIAWVERPILYIRVFTWLMALLIVAGAAVAVQTLMSLLPGGVTSPSEFVQMVESGIQDLVFVGFGLVFLTTAEGRIKRRRALRFIRELRAMAHVVDMHQLTKDPDSLLEGRVDTASSPKRTYTRRELGRYLDYCSEMLSLTSKIAALYADRFDDAVVLQAVDEVETISTNLSGKIWQKIMMLDEGKPAGE